MKNKGKINHSVQEGIFFLLVGAALLGYAVTSYEKAFNKNWSQSPYLFPMMVAAVFLFLAVCLIKEGTAQWKTGAGDGSRKKQRGEAVSGEAGRREAVSGEAERRETVSGETGRGKPVREAGNWKGIGIVLLLCIVYYGALFYVKMPYINVGIFTFFFTFSTFEVATWLFLIVMMAYMGVRKPLILAAVPLGFTLFLSIAFRTMLNVLLP